MSLVVDDLDIDGLILGSGNPTRKAARVGTTGPGTLATDFENGDTLDGVTLITSDRILIKNQTDGTENGIYEVQSSGTPIRTDDYEAGTAGGGLTVYVQEGTILQDTGWFCINDEGSDNIGTDALTYQQITGSGVDGNMNGPGVSVTDNTVVRWDGTSGTNVQESGVVIDDSDNVTGVNSVNWTTGSNDAQVVATTQTVGLGTFNLPNLAGATTDLVGTTIGQTITNKTFSTGNTWNGNTITVARGGTGAVTHGTGNVLVGNGTGAILSTKAAPTGDFVGTTDTQTLSAKTLITPIIAQISNSGILTLPSGTTDTLVARNTTDTLTNKTLTSPRIGTALLDTSGNELLAVTATASAVNELTIANAATGNAPTLSVTGDDTDIDFSLVAKGAGVFTFDADDASESAEIRLLDNPGTGYVGISAANTTTSYTLVMPDAQGGADEVLQNNGSGVLSWQPNESGAIDNNIVSSTVQVSTTSTTFITVPSMTITPAAGTYIVTFSSSGLLTTANDNARYGIFNDGTLTDHSERYLSTEGNQTDDLDTALYTQSRETVNGSQAIETRYRMVNGGAFVVRERNMILIKVA